MFTNSPIFTNFSRQSRFISGGWWLVMAPGLLLTVVALAILVWPELLAYMVAGVLLFAGVSLTRLLRVDMGCCLRLLPTLVAKPEKARFPVV